MFSESSTVILQLAAAQARKRNSQKLFTKCLTLVTTRPCRMTLIFFYPIILISQYPNIREIYVQSLNLRAQCNAKWLRLFPEREVVLVLSILIVILAVVATTLTLTYQGRVDYRVQCSKECFNSGLSSWISLGFDNVANHQLGAGRAMSIPQNQEL